MTQYVSKHDVSAATGFRLDLIRDLHVICGNPPGPAVPIRGHGPRAWEKGHDIDGYAAWLRARVPAFTAAAEQRLRELARPALREAADAP